MNVVGYIRVSTQGQARDGYSLKYQEEEIKVYCKEQGLNLIHIFRDEGICGARSFGDRHPHNYSKVMEAGSGGRNKPYFRVSIDGKGSLTRDGKIFNDRSLPHIDITDDALKQIDIMIKSYKGK